MAADVDELDSLTINHYRDELSDNQPLVRQTLFQALGITEWAQQ